MPDDHLNEALLQRQPANVALQRHPLRTDVGPFDRGAKVEGTFGKQSFGVDVLADSTAKRPVTCLDDFCFLAEARAAGSLVHVLADGGYRQPQQAWPRRHGRRRCCRRNLHTGLVWGVDQAFEGGTAMGQPGHATSFNSFVDVHKPNYEINFTYNDNAGHNPLERRRSHPDIRGPLGYVNLVGSTPGIKNYGIYLGADRFFDETGQVHESDTIANFGMTFKNGISLNKSSNHVAQLALAAPVHGRHVVRRERERIAFPAEHQRDRRLRYPRPEPRCQLSRRIPNRK